ncbi:retrovirus-related pol polyprotein from transposon TNT 1-94 [Tanacetum coccineum]
MAVRDFKKFFKRRECPKPPKDKNLRAFIGGSWSDSGEEDDEKKVMTKTFVSWLKHLVRYALELTWNPTSGYKIMDALNTRRATESSFQHTKHTMEVTSSLKVIYVVTHWQSEIVKDGKFIGKGLRKKGLRLCHANMRLIQSLASKKLLRNFPKLKFDQHFYDACKIGKQAHTSHKAKNVVTTTRCLELLHMDLFNPSAIRSYGGNLSTLGIVDDYSRTDHGREFDNEVQFGEFCNANGITHNFSAPRTSQSNSVVERKNRTLQEMSRTMLNERSLPQKFWCNVVDTSTYILNRILIRAILGKTPYELLRGRKPTIYYFRVFGRKCFNLNTKYYLTKFDPKSYEGVFLGYSQNSKAYIILNKHTMKIKESLNVTFDKTPPPSKTSPLVDDDLDEEEAIKLTEKKNLENDIEDDETIEMTKEVQY